MFPEMAHYNIGTLTDIPWKETTCQLEIGATGNDRMELLNELHKERIKHLYQHVAYIVDKY